MPPDHVAHVQGLFVQHLPALRGFVLSLVSNFGHVDDVVQETFIAVTKKATDFEPGTNFRAWAWTIARYKALQFIEKHGTANEHLSPEVIEALCAHDSARDWHTEELLSKLGDCIGELAPKARQAIELRYMQALRPPDVARVMNWTVDAVHVVLARARIVLRECVTGRATREAAGGPVV
ncbi:sigma-70 family RNA polymerase sigma factor [Verrucomicrobiota bacterium sgz303538]